MTGYILTEARVDTAWVGGAPTASDHPAWDQLLAQTLTHQRVHSVFQPIVDLRRGVPVGYEALIRFDLAQATPDRWFAAAAHRGLVPELEALSVSSAARHRWDLPANCFLAVNLEPETMLHHSATKVLDQLGDLAGIVIEITEHRPIASYEALEPVLDRLRNAGARIAVDDAGAGHAGLQQILALQPSILKLDRSLVEGIDHNEAKAALVEMLGTFANRVDAWLLAEGVETMAEARTLARLGVPLVQGFLFAKPTAPWGEIDDSVHPQLIDAVAEHTASGVAPYLDAVACVGDDDLGSAARLLADDEQLRHVVVIDSLHRPVGLMTPESLLDGRMVTALCAGVSSSMADIARRLVARGDSTMQPVMIVDDRARYVGILTVERLLSGLARL